MIILPLRISSDGNPLLAMLIVFSILAIVFNLLGYYIYCNTELYINIESYKDWLGSRIPLMPTSHSLICLLTLVFTIMFFLLSFAASLTWIVVKVNEHLFTKKK